MKYKEFKVGDKVFDIRYGWGVIISTNNARTYLIKVLFNNGSVQSYTEEGFDVVDDINPILSHTEYGTINERVIEVLLDNEWVKRVLITIKDGEAICWTGATTIEEAKKSNSVSIRPIWRELQEESLVELTLKDISEGKGVGVPEHLIRIKK